MASESLRDSLGFEPSNLLHDQSLETSVTAHFTRCLVDSLSAQTTSLSLPSHQIPNIALELSDGLLILCDCQISPIRTAMTPLQGRDLLDKWQEIHGMSDRLRVIYLLITNYALYDQLRSELTRLGVSVFTLDLDEPAQETKKRFTKAVMHLIASISMHSRPEAEGVKVESGTAVSTGNPEGDELTERIVRAALMDDDDHFYQLVELARRQGARAPLAAEWMELLNAWAEIAQGEAAVRMRARMAILSGTTIQKNPPGAEVSSSEQERVEPPD